MRNIKTIILHCTDTPNDRAVTIEEIGQWHKLRGFQKVGYHYVIYRDGTIHQGRKDFEVGAHCQGYNADSLGVCLVGQDKFRETQFESLLYLIDKLIIKHSIASYSQVKCHYEFNPNKSCPNIKCEDLRNALNSDFIMGMSPYTVKK